MLGFGAEPTTFILSFTPLEYKMKFAKLIIETDEYYLNVDAVTNDFVDIVFEMKSV